MTCPGSANTRAVTWPGTEMEAAPRQRPASRPSTQEVPDRTDGSKPISRRQRFEILRRDGHTCRYCGAQAPDVPLTVDHVIPRALGGSDDPTNLVTACRDCNGGKGSTSPDEHIVADVDAAALLFGRAMERASELRRQELQHLDHQMATFDERWCTWTFGLKDYQVPRPSDWNASVERFLAAGLTPDELGYYIEVAMRSHAQPDATWRYFCGCCWREITNRQEMARRLIEDGTV